MYKVFVGGISPEGEHLLTTYLNVFMPDAVIEPLKAVGIKGKMKNHAKRQDVALVILDESLYQACVGVADDVLSLPKVHKYTDDESLNQFLISKFGKLDGVSVSEPSVLPPDMLMQSEDRDDFIPKNNDDIFVSPNVATTPPDKIIEGSAEIVHRVVEDSYDNLAVSDEDTTSKEQDSELIAELQDKLAKSEMMVHNLTLQLEDKSSNSDDDIAAFVARIRELEQQIEEKDKQLASSGENNYVQLGKVARAEQIITEFDSLKEKLKTANEDKSQLEYDKNNLTSQVELLHGKVDELKNQVAEIEVLRETIRGRDDEVNKLSSELDNKVAEITDLNSKLNELQDSSSTELESLKLEIDGLNKNINSMQDELTKAQEEIVSKQSELEHKETELADALSEISNLKTELEQKVSVISAKEEEINEALKISSDSDNTISELRNQINDLSSKISELEGIITSKDSEIALLKQSDSELNAQFESKVAELESIITSKDNEINSLDQRGSELESIISSKDNELNALRQSDKELNAELESRVLEIETYKSVKSDLNKKIEELDNCKAEIENLNNQITNLQSELSNKESEITKLSEENSIAMNNNEVQTQAVDKVLQEKNELEDKLVDAETQKLELESTITKLQSQIDNMKNDILDKDTSILEHKAKREELELQISKLQSEVISAKADNETVSRLERDLLEERKKSAKLTSEVEVLRKTDDSSKTSELRIEIARLKSELDSVKASSETASLKELEICKNELQESRERCSNLEMDIAEKSDIIKELETGVFGQMAGVALAKAVFNVNLPSLSNIPENFYCVAGGSSESNLVLYQLLKKSCTYDTSKRILILDLATDSYIDREFGIQQATSPVAWLEGSEDFRSYIAGTRYNNIRVLTTALSYLNDLSLLNVDWQKRMMELSGFSADVVIINIGCLNNVITKILFNMFSHAMTSYVVTKATPINLRSVILNLAGFKDVSYNVTVSCVGFDKKASRNMYQRLVAKHKAQILTDSDVLKL